MNAFVHVVDHAHECFKADCSGWWEVICGANALLTCHDLEGFAALCNQSFDAMEDEYYHHENWQFLFLEWPTNIQIRNGVKGHKEDKESNFVGSDNESWDGSFESTGGRKYFLAYHQ
jgi:hypothetical protein